MNKTRYVVLGLLAERPYSGYELKQIIGLRFGLFWKESYGQLYPELKRMTAEGLATAVVEGARSKTTYTITALGLKSLKEWLATEADEDQVRSELLLKLYFSAFAPDSVREKHLETFRDRAKRQVHWLRQAADQLQALIDDDVTHPRALAIVRLGLAQQEAQCTWAEEELKSQPGEAVRPAP